MTRFASDETPAFQPEELDFAEIELRIALAFADVSLTAYKSGRLRRACDAGSKAESLCNKAAERLRHMESGPRTKLLLQKVQDKLAQTPKVRAAG